MTNERQSMQEHFRLVLFTVVGQAFSAAGYQLEENAVRWAGGRYRFVKSLGGGLNGFIEFQLLAYTDTEYAARMPSRFRVMLARSDQPSPYAASTHPQFALRTLSALVVEDFGVPILPSAGHWWTFSDTEALGRALAEAGHLVAGYGIAWLAGDLLPPSG
jgi:hypothetical protein